MTATLDKTNTYLADFGNSYASSLPSARKKISHMNDIGDKYLNTYEDVEVVLRD